MHNKSKAMRKLMEELKIPFFTPSEEQYMKEYIKVMKPITDALDIFQGEKNIPYETGSCFLAYLQLSI